MKELTPQERFDRYVGFVKDGQPSYEREARELATQHGFSLQALEDALPIGRQREAERKQSVYRTK